MKSDKFRMSLLNEEAELTQKLEGGDATVGDRLKEVDVGINFPAAQQLVCFFLRKFFNLFRLLKN